MRFEELVQRFGGLPIIDTELLLSGSEKLRPDKVQISRWEKSGKIIKLRRGIYLLNKLYRKMDIFEPFIAYSLKNPSYISLEKALELHNLIPEAVAVYTSVTTKRAGRFSSSVGVFNYQHIQQSLFWGYKSVTLNRQTGFIATPEKALLDLIYFRGMRISGEFIEGLRLQNTGKMKQDNLLMYARKFHKPSMVVAADIIIDFMRQARKKEKKL